MSETAGFIGLGSQGGPMAMRIIEEGFSTMLWARRVETLEPYRGTSAGIAASIRELGTQCDHVGLCVVDDDGTSAVCGELLESMRVGSRIAIHATVHPDTCVAIAEQAAVRGIAVIDAPVSGGGAGAANRTLTVMVGGDDATVAAARPIFKAFAGRIVHLGGVGAGQRAKLVNNTLMAANLGLATDALEAAVALGIDRAAFAELVTVSSGRSYAFEVAARLPHPRAFRQGAPLLRKDVDLLGILMRGAPAYEALRAAADPFLMNALDPSS